MKSNENGKFEEQQKKCRKENEKIIEFVKEQKRKLNERKNNPKRSS